MIETDSDVSVDADALRFLGHVLEAYFQWRSNDPHLEPPCSSRVWRAPQPVENRRVLNLSDDQFVRVDQAYAGCEHQQIILREYTETGSTMQKAKREGFVGPNYGAVVGAYRARLRLAEVELYWLLTPDVQMWHQQREEVSL